MHMNAPNFLVSLHEKKRMPSIRNDTTTKISSTWMLRLFEVVTMSRVQYFMSGAYTAEKTNHGRGRPINMSKMLDPMQLDTAMSPKPWRATDMLDIRSGTLVPMASLSTLAGGLLLSSTIWCRHAVLSYALLILYNGCFAFLISLAASSIAAANMAHVKRHEGDGPADAPKPSVLFGVNGFMSLLFASGLQVVASGMALTARHVMLMCGGVFCAVSLVCAVLLLAGRERR